MSNIAVIKLAGAQHLVRAGDKFEVNRLDYEVEKDMSADVLLSTDGEKMLLNEGDVQIKVLEHKKGDKLRIVKFRAKSRYRKAQGHRQHLSLVEVLSVNGQVKEKKAKSVDKKVSTTEVVSAESKPAKKATVKKTPTASKSSAKAEKKIVKTKKGTK